MLNNSDIISLLFSKSVKVKYIHSAITFISSSFIPLDVTAGVPILIPLVIDGFSGSNGIAFLFTVIPTSSNLVSATTPVILRFLKSNKL